MKIGISFALLTGFTIMAHPCHAQTITNPDAMPAKAIMDKKANMVDTLQIKEFADVFDKDLPAALTIENLYKALDKYDVKCKKIVVAQALLETGNFTSSLCLLSHNLFGLRHPSDGSYYVFNNWEESVKAYKDDVQYKYDGGDYYVFLNRIGYAQDPKYTSKVKLIASGI